MQSSLKGGAVKRFLLSFLALAILLSSSAQSLGRTLEEFKAAYEREVARINDDGTKKTADASYLRALGRVKDAATRRADLATVKAAIAEKKRFQQFSNLTDEMPEKQPAAIEEIQTGYRKVLGDAQAARDRRVLELSRKYVAAPKKLIVSQMKAERLDDASKTDEEVKRIEFTVADIESRLPRAAPPRPRPSPSSPAEPPIRQSSTIREPEHVLILDLGGGVEMEFAWIQPGSFMMGSPDGEAGHRHRQRERPVHRVNITKGFWMSKYEVAQKQYEQVTGKNPSRFSGDENPVERVSWHDAKGFCKVLTEKLDKTVRLPLRMRRKIKSVRLPTEAEWEYACRAGTSTRFYTGDSETDLSMAGYWGKNSGGKTHPAGQKKPNAWGLYDMHGNVWEWCQDWYDESYYRKSPATDPEGPDSGSDRVIRGGCWGLSAGEARAAYRLLDAPGDKRDRIGFRVCLTPGDH